MKRYLLALLLTTNALAGEAFLSGGVAVLTNTDLKPRVINVGYREEIYNGVYAQWKGGYWKDFNDRYGKSSFYFATGLGILIDFKPLEIRHGWSIAVITQPDGYLGGYFPQFNGEFYVGLRDRVGNGIGFQYEHISSAGFVNPNVGRDFLMLQISQKW